MIITERMIFDAANAAAWWWGARLRDGVGVGDDGEPGFRSFAMRALSHEQRAGQLTEVMALAFELHLALAIRTVLSGDDWNLFSDQPDPWSEERIPELRLKVDYHPQPILFDALIASGVPEHVASMSALPLKARMFVSARRVLASHRYGGDLVEVFGPLWGVPYADGRASERARSEAGERMYDLWIDAMIDKHGRSCWSDKLDAADRANEPTPLDWQGPVRW